MVRLQIGMRADGGDEPRGEVAPVTEVNRQRRPDFARAEGEQSVTRATSERGFERAAQRGVGRRSVALVSEQQAAARGQRERRHE